MPKITITTDDGREVWSQDHIASSFVRHLQGGAGNIISSSLAATIRRAVEDAEAIQAGRDPKRPSEKAMRLSEDGTRA
jgi:hypothetical protein